MVIQLGVLFKRTQNYSYKVYMKVNVYLERNLSNVQMLKTGLFLAQFPFLSLLFKLWLIYNGVPISTVQQTDSVIYIIFIFLYYFPSWSIPGD